MPLEYETWRAVVFTLTWATNRSGAVALWLNGKKAHEYTGFQTVKAPRTFERLQIWGTFAQPAYDAPPHVRKVDAMLFPDDRQDIGQGRIPRGRLRSQPAAAIPAPEAFAVSVLVLNSSRNHAAMNANTTPCCLSPTLSRSERALLAMPILAACLTWGMGAAAGEQTPAGLLFSESFDDAQLQQRGWYDVTAVRIAGQSAAGRGCIEYEWTDPQSGVGASSPARHLFEPTDEVAIRFYLKLSEGWGWSGQNYHPHLTHFLTTENSAWHGPAASHLTLYIEPVGGKLRLAAQDIQNEKAPHGLTQGPLRGGYNGTFYDSAKALFKDDQWHCVEAYFRLNTLDLKNDRAHPDGIVRGWFDGRLVIEQTNVVLRSPDFPKMKFNQFLMAPYFGPGLLPHAQRLWIDELAVGTRRIGTLPATPSATTQPGGNVPRGIAAAYPGDVGIEKDPAVVFAESFEGTGFERWNNAEPPRAPEVQLVKERTRVHSGKQAVQFTVPPGKGVGAGLVKWVKPGYDQLYARWYCLEIMVKANTPGEKDGEQAFWVDGELIGRFTGIRWRDTETLKLNCFWPSMYIHDSPQTNRLWMDDMVVATKYIGPQAKQATFSL